MNPNQIQTRKTAPDPQGFQMNAGLGNSEGRGKKDRIPWVDFLRGIAIILMIPANLSPYYAEPHAMWYRVMSSLAAPTFISLSAGMVILNSQKHHFNYYLTRGAFVVLIGVLLDTLLWRILPFASVDVLYVIGIGIPLMYLVRQQKMSALVASGGILILAGPFLQTLLGYHPDVLEIELGNIYLPDLSRVAASWLVDGYFPLFPWLGYTFVGAALFRYVFQEKKQIDTVRLSILGLILLVIGALLLFVPTSAIPNLTNGGILVTREGYSEIFYPPTYGFVFFSNGAILIQVVLFVRVRRNFLSAIPMFFGEYCMLVYISHQVLGEYGLKPLLAWAGVEQVFSDYLFVVINLVMFIVVAALCKLADLAKRAHPPRNVFLQIIVGK
ncbi:MAG: hypothetical protein H6Q54_465 [Deltaproteobacteria bacterium]|jgi:uncharacterized membrane protein|nr:hypothetical protein [Deltaproteobacteria bacterium]